MSVTARQVVEALKHRYVGEESSATNISSEDLAVFVRSFPADQIPADHSILEAIALSKTDWILSGSDVAILHSVRDCMTIIFKLVNLDEAVLDRIGVVTPVLAAALIKQPALPLTNTPYSIFSILDLLLTATIGWSSDQGRAGENLLTQVTAVIDELLKEEADYQSIETDLCAFLDKEQSRIKKLEERLSASESGKLRSQRARIVAAEMINACIEGTKLTKSIIQFLKGPWNESMQLLAVTKGLGGEDWIRASKLTETIIWTYQPITGEDEQKTAAERQRLYRIIEHLPAEIHDLLLTLEHSGEDSEAALGELEDDRVAIVSGQELEYVEFSPIEVDGNSVSQRTSVSRILLRKVSNLEPGQWFTFNENEKSTRIKLVLKLEDVKQLLFTNRNGMKALEKNYDDMAYLMSSGVIKLLNHEAIFSSTFATFFQGLIDEHQRKLKLAEQADEQKAQKAAAREEAVQKAEELARARKEAEAIRMEEEKEIRLKNAMIEAAKAENQEKVAEFTEQVNNLNVGAWLKLPAADGRLEECKLAVKVAVSDKLIFVSRTGEKIGDYSTEQLITLLVAGEGEINDSGVEFEDTLVQVVTKLRQDRDKSYDDLTGS